MIKVINESFDINDDLKDLWEFIQEQEYDSAATSRPQIAAAFGKIKFEPGTLNVDYGGGKYDLATEYLKTLDVINCVYDPFNRNKEHNKQVTEIVKEYGGADTVTCNNVLNVIDSSNARLTVLKNMDRLLKSGGTAYISVYEKDRSGKGAPTKNNSYQTNMKLKQYMDEITKVFSNAKYDGKNQMIVCKT